MTAQAHWLADGRLHLHHGPIDLIVDIEGSRDAYARAVQCFAPLLETLVPDLPVLRRPPPQKARTPVARRMIEAVAPWTHVFVTPMAAVAGAVADEILAAICAQDGVTKAVVNNGGDVAFHLEPGQTLTGLGLAGSVQIDATSPVRGIATSGWRGRSHSLGIADAVTVVAASAAAADVAATLIANAVDLPGHPAITRQPARDLSPDSDLGHRLVTTDVGPLRAADVAKALSRGQNTALWALERGLIQGATLTLNGATASVQHDQKEAIDA